MHLAGNIAQERLVGFVEAHNFTFGAFSSIRLQKLLYGFWWSTAIREKLSIICRIRIDDSEIFESMSQTITGVA